VSSKTLANTEFFDIYYKTNLLGCSGRDREIKLDQTLPSGEGRLWGVGSEIEAAHGADRDSNATLALAGDRGPARQPGPWGVRGPARTSAP